MVPDWDTPWVRIISLGPWLDKTQSPLVLGWMETAVAIALYAPCLLEASIWCLQHSYFLACFRPPHFHQLLSLWTETFVGLILSMELLWLRQYPLSVLFYSCDKRPIVSPRWATMSTSRIHCGACIHRYRFLLPHFGMRYLFLFLVRWRGSGCSKVSCRQ